MEYSNYDQLHKLGETIRQFNRRRACEEVIKRRREFFRTRWNLK